MRRLVLSKSKLASLYATPRLTVVPAAVSSQSRARGPGGGRQVRFAIWGPVKHQGELIGAVIYQSHRKRRVPDAELAFIDEVHRRLGVLLANASLNELTRNQARRLEALNSIGRAMASTLDEASVLTGLHTTLRELLPVDSLEMVTLQDDSDRARYLDLEANSVPRSRLLPPKSPLAATAR